jgi:transcriptional regulator
LHASAFHYREYCCDRPDLIDRMIEHYPLALVNSEQQRQLHASHIPLFRAADRTLFGHVDRRNPQFQNQRSFRARLAFIGPQRYIPPEAYRSRLLPTWNYVAVHMEATIEVLDDPEAILIALRDTCDRLQPRQASFQFDADDTRVIASLPHLLALRVRTSYEEGRFKLSQDKGDADRNGALSHLLKRDESEERDLLHALMNFSTVQQPTDE